MLLNFVGENYNTYQDYNNEKNGVDFSNSYVCEYVKFPQNYIDFFLVKDSALNNEMFFDTLVENNVLKIDDSNCEANNPYYKSTFYEGMPFYELEYVFAGLKKEMFSKHYL